MNYLHLKEERSEDCYLFFIIMGEKQWRLIFNKLLTDFEKEQGGFWG